jgi:hypothetical protein
MIVYKINGIRGGNRDGVDKESSPCNDGPSTRA